MEQHNEVCWILILLVLVCHGFYGCVGFEAIMGRTLSIDGKDIDGGYQEKDTKEAARVRLTTGGCYEGWNNCGNTGYGSHHGDESGYSPGKGGGSYGVGIGGHDGGYGNGGVGFGAGGGRGGGIGTGRGGQFDSGFGNSGDNGGGWIGGANPGWAGGNRPGSGWGSGSIPRYPGEGSGGRGDIGGGGQYGGNGINVR